MNKIISYKINEDTIKLIFDGVKNTDKKFVEIGKSMYQIDLLENLVGTIKAEYLLHSKQYEEYFKGIILALFVYLNNKFKGKVNIKEGFMFTFIEEIKDFSHNFAVEMLRISEEIEKENEEKEEKEEKEEEKE